MRALAATSRLFFVVLLLIVTSANAFPPPQDFAGANNFPKKAASDRSPRPAAATSLNSATGAALNSDGLPLAFEWCANLGAPAALVAGAVLATASEHRQHLLPCKDDARWVRRVKNWCRFLLLSSFTLEIFSIFVTTVTSTLLLKTDFDLEGGAYKTAMDLLLLNFEYEVIVARATFVQGLFGWLGAVALKHLIPNEGESVAARKFNLFIFSWMILVISAMVGFFNNSLGPGMTGNFAGMYCQWIVATVRRWLWRWPPRPISLVMLPAFGSTCILGWQAFNAPLTDHDEQK